eukprot:11186362-Lingulodinium_polyedra.AAC.1
MDSSFGRVATVEDRAFWLQRVVSLWVGHSWCTHCLRRLHRQAFAHLRPRTLGAQTPAGGVGGG